MKRTGISLLLLAAVLPAVSNCWAETLAERPSLFADYLGKDSALSKAGVTLNQSITAVS